MNVRASPSGFLDPVLDSQAVFRAVMMALARPGTIADLPCRLVAPPPLTDELAAVAIALCDHETSIWLDAPLAEDGKAAPFLRFHTGAAIIGEPADADFAVAIDPAALPPLDAFTLGSDEYPDRSTTLVMEVASLANTGGFVIEGPGIKGHKSLAINPLPRNFARQWAENHALFPRGVDCIFVSAGKVAALPRSTRILEA